MLDAACEADAIKTLKAVSVMDNSKRRGTLWSACNFAQWGLVPTDVGADSDSSAMLLAHMAFVAIKNAGPVDANERALLEMLARSTAAP